MDFIEINDKDDSGGFLIINDKIGREIADKILEDSKYIEKETTNGKTKRIKEQESEGEKST